MDKEDLEVVDRQESVALMANGTLLAKWDKINPGAQIVLTNGTQQTISASLYRQLERYCEQNNYQIVQNQIVGEYRGHSNQ